MKYFYHYSAVKNSSQGLPSYFHGTIVMDRKIICDETMLEFVDKVSAVCAIALPQDQHEEPVIMSLTLLSTSDDWS